MQSERQHMLQFRYQVMLSIVGLKLNQEQFKVLTKCLEELGMLFEVFGAFVSVDAIGFFIQIVMVDGGSIWELLILRVFIKIIYSAFVFLFFVKRACADFQLLRWLLRGQGSGKRACFLKFAEKQSVSDLLIGDKLICCFSTLIRKPIAYLFSLFPFLLKQYLDLLDESVKQRYLLYDGSGLSLHFNEFRKILFLLEKQLFLQLFFKHLFIICLNHDPTPFIGIKKIPSPILKNIHSHPSFLEVDNNNITMSDSDEEGFHQSSVQMLTIKTKHMPELRQNIIKCKNAYLFRSPLSLHHQLPLFEYPKQLDHLSFSPVQAIPPHSSQCLNLVQANEQFPILLSQFFPRKLNCVYNRFRQNLILKRDTTILIRNIGNRVRNDQIITFHDLQEQNQGMPLAFSSNFEGGNLHCVFKDRKTGYLYLLLQNDINTHGYNIWFHFRAKATVSAIYQFVIVNLSKEVKFDQEVALLTYSSLRRQYERIVGFKCEETRFRHSQSSKRFWSLHFQYKFQTGEEVYFSQCPPYTFSKLLRVLKGVVQSNMKAINVSTEVAGKTELGNYIPCLKVASRERPSKNCILITARQHPCETVSSFLCDAMIRILTNSSLLVHELLDSYTIFILPMLNPDGVVHGNSRTNLTGYDINRNWDMSSPIKTAENSQIWTYILHLIEEEYQIGWAFDLHGHSKELGYFAYFCEENKHTLLLSHFMDSMGNFYQRDKCGFCLSRGKKQSIRGQLYSKLKVSNAVTIETSYYGFRNTNGQLVQYTLMHFHQMALSILQSIVDTQRAINDRAFVQKITQESPKNSNIVQRPSPTRLVQEILSDSDPEEDYLRKQERNEEELGVILGRKNIKFRTKTESNKNLSEEIILIRPNKSSKISTSLIKDGHFSAFKKSGTLDKQRNGTFYAGRRTFSPRSLQKCMQRPKIRKKIEIDSRLRSTLHDDSQDDEYLKKSFTMRRRFGQQKQEDQHRKEKTYVGGFRTCYEVSSLKTIQYPTTTSAGIDFQNNLKSKKETIKQIRSRQLVPSHLKPRKLSDTYYH